MSEPFKFSVNGIEYLQEDIDTFKQFDLCIEAAPITYSMTDNPLSFVDALNNMPRDKRKFLIELIMPVIKRNDHGSWCHVYVQGIMAYPDIDAADLTFILVNVINRYIIDFVKKIDLLT